MAKPDKGHASEMGAFLDFVRTGVSVCSFADCVSSMAATFKVVESLTTGAPVDVPRVDTVD
jgi:hypothetical protein